MTIPLDIKVRAALQLRRGEWKDVVRCCDVSYSWLTKFAGGHMKNPAHHTLVRLDTHLAEKKGQ